MDLRELLEPLDLDPPQRRPWMYAVAATIGVLAIGSIWLMMRPDGAAAPTAAAPTTTALIGDTAEDSAPAEPGAPTTTAALTTTSVAGPPDLTGEAPPSARIDIPTSDGLTLHGTHFEGGPRGVLIVHEYDTGSGGPTDTEALLPLAIGFARAGYTVVMFDHRGHGLSDGDPSHDALAADIAAAYASLAGIDGITETFVAAWGVSGTAAVIAQESRAVDADALSVIFGRPQYLGLDAQAAMAEIGTPVQFVTVDTGRTTQWARRFMGAAAEGTVVLDELPTPPTGGDRLIDFWPFVVERVLAFFDAPPQG